MFRVLIGSPSFRSFGVCHFSPPRRYETISYSARFSDIKFHSNFTLMSRILSADDLNDFIGPSQVCIKPVEIVKTGNANESEIQADGQGGYYEVTKDGQSTKLKEATISLNDCLACSGCITSAESLLISQQSTAEVTSTIDREMSLPPHQRARFMASLSPQSRASIAAYYNLSMQAVYLKLHSFFTTVLPFEAVFDTNIAREISLVEGASEFQTRYLARHSTTSQGLLPVICASCPGWVCYAEKTHHGILPYLSTTRSPQQIMGAMIKKKFSREWGVEEGRIWHLSVMPCFDKKLEASRDDFAEDGVRDVDCVITTAELLKMIESYGMSLPDIPESTTLSSIETRMTSHAAKSLFGLDVDIANARGVQIKTVRSGDMVEYTLTEAGQTKLRMAQCYGFRNIQNLVRKLEGKKGKVIKKKNSPEGSDQWDYVEVMACPSGCINGGGQIPTPSGERVYSPKEWVQMVEQTYQGQTQEWPDEGRVKAIYREWFGEADREIVKKRFVETAYHKVDFTLENPLLLGSRW